MAAFRNSSKIFLHFSAITIATTHKLLLTSSYAHYAAPKRQNFWKFNRFLNSQGNGLQYWRALHTEKHHIHGCCRLIYIHQWVLLIPIAHLSNSGASSSQQSITGASHETRRLEDITHKFTVTQHFQYKQEQYDLTTAFTSQLNLPDDQRDTYFKNIRVLHVKV